MGTFSHCPAWCERQGVHVTHETLWASEAGVGVWLRGFCDNPPWLRVIVADDDPVILYTTPREAAKLAAIFDRLGHPTLADALRRCTRVVVAEVEAAVGERR